MSRKPDHHLDPDNIGAIRQMRRAGYAWDSIAERFGVSSYIIRCAIDVGFRERECARARKHRVRTPEKVGDGSRGFARIERAPPPELIDDRNRRLHLARTLTSIICGDPPPGYSALDRRQ